MRIKTFINPDGTSVSNLGREREGSGIVIDESGLVLTIGYLMVEAHAAEVITNAGRTLPASVVGYDHETGFGLLRTLEPLKIKPLAFGKSADVKEQDPALVASFGGAGMVLPVRVASRREFTGSWEYLVDGAIFTRPPHPAWSGAALINREGKLVGVGSLIVGDANGENDNTPGNMFVPIDLLAPILGDLLANGRVSGRAGPGSASTRRRCTAGCSSAASRRAARRKRPGSSAATSSSASTARRPGRCRSFYRKVWALGAAGVTVPLDVLSDSEPRRVEVQFGQPARHPQAEIDVLMRAANSAVIAGLDPAVHDELRRGRAAKRLARGGLMGPVKPGMSRVGGGATLASLRFPANAAKFARDLSAAGLP